MYLEFYGFKDPPFNSTPNPRYFYHSAGHLDAASRITDAIVNKRRMLFLTGEHGTGKTTLINGLSNSLFKNGLTTRFYYKALSGNQPSPNLFKEFRTGHACHSFTEMVIEMQRNAPLSCTPFNNSVLVFDEAEKIDMSDIADIRLLWKFEASQSNRLVLMLAGQPEVENKVEELSLLKFDNQRSLKCELSRLSHSETRDYISYRLRVGTRGPRKRLFTDDAIDLIYALSDGLPSRVNALCNNALCLGYLKQCRHIDVKIVEEAKTDSILRRLRALRTKTAHGKPVKSRPKVEHQSSKSSARKSEIPKPDSEKPASRPRSQPSGIVRQHCVRTRAKKAFPRDLLQDLQKIVENVNGARSQSEGQIIGFTSATPGEGVSTVAALVASLVSDSEMSFRSENRAGILLVETHANRPSLAELFGVKATHGLNDFLDERVSPESILTGCSVPGLNVLAAGRNGDSAAQSDLNKLEHLLIKIRSKFKYIFLDLPSVLHSSDGVNLSRLCDGVVMVVRAGRTRTEVLQEAKNRLQQAEVRVLGGVLNKREFFIPKSIYDRLLGPCQEMPGNEH